jgi:alpha-galactosidase
VARGAGLHDVGYQFANLDDGWQACGQGVNGSFHDANGYPIMDPVKFPNVTAMAAKAGGSEAYTSDLLAGSFVCTVSVVRLPLFFALLVLLAHDGSASSAVNQPGTARSTGRLAI